MRPIEIMVKRLPFNALAMTLWPFILYKTTSDCIREHELYHWRQQWRWLILPWFATYLILAPFYRGRIQEHPLERPAYRVQAECERGT